MRAQTPTHTFGLIGLGFWGEKLLRATHEIGVNVIGTDIDPKQRAYITRRYPYSRVVPTVDDLFRNPDITAYIIATPPATHFQLAKNALMRHKPVLVEKPMTQRSIEAKRLITLADTHKTALMVDHIYLFSPVVHILRALIQKKSIGAINHIISTRDTGRRHPGSSVLWDLIPHDVSIASFLLNAHPIEGSVITVPSLGTPIEDAMYQLRYPNHMFLQGTVRWNTPIKKRTMEIIGESGAISVEWNDGTETYSLFSHNTSKGQDVYKKQKTITLKQSEEPMKLMLRHFMRAIHTRTSPTPDGTHAHNVIRAIEALERSARSGGKLIRI